MPHADLQTYRDGFFEKFLADLPGSPTLAALEAQQPAGQPLVLMGDYIEYTGAAITPLPNASITPQFAIRVEVDGTPRTFVMLWVVERFDVATDSPDTIARILGDFRSPAASGAADAGSIANDLARTWSQALTGDAVRQALAKNINEITAVPTGLPTSDLEELRIFLRHFGTYKPDGSYYAKGAVVEGEFPNGVSAEYLNADTGNLSEVRLHRDQFYCYAIASERLWSPQADGSRSRQLVYRLDDQGSDGVERWRLALLHTVGTNQPGAVIPSRFIFFHAPVGIGLAVPQPARTVIAPSTAALIEELPAHLSNLPEALADTSIPIVGSPDSPYVLLMGAVREGFPRTPLPEGVIEDGEGAVRTFRCPPPHLEALAHREDIENLVAATPVWPCMQHALNEINYAGRTFPAGITAQTTGHDVVVGIVDSGIDGGHPAFLGRHDDATKSRIHSVWNLWESGGDSPYKRSGNKDVYRSMNFGKEYIGHDQVVTVQDDGGHGTHVAGIAAGRAVGTWPGGVSPAATIVVAAVGSRGGYVNDVLAGVKYCFQKATELNRPCVVNISLATERHSHDGTDPLSVALTQLVSQNFVPATGLGVLPSAMPNYIDGRIICAAAGNLRNDRTHWQATIPAGGDVSVVYQPSVTGSTNNADGITFWAYNEDATTVRLRISTRHATNPVLATAEVGLRTSNARVTTNLPNGVRVNIHNGPQAPNNRHFNPEIYWIRSASAPAFPAGPWIIRLRNVSRSACTIHGFAAFREFAGSFVFAPAQTQPLIGVTYTLDQQRQFNSHKIGTPGTAPGCICVAAFTSEPGQATPVDEIAWFSSPGPLRAAGPGRRAIDVALPGSRIVSAKAWTPTDNSRGVVAMEGTSMASPVMTGLVAALFQVNRNVDTGDLRTKLESAATRRATDTVDDWGLGRVDAAVLLRP
jgi:subtilisin family serine protease